MSSPPPLAAKEEGSPTQPQPQHTSAHEGARRTPCSVPVRHAPPTFALPSGNAKCITRGRFSSIQHIQSEYEGSDHGSEEPTHSQMVCRCPGCRARGILPGQQSTSATHAARRLCALEPASCLVFGLRDGGRGGYEHSEAGYGRPVDGGVWTAKTVKRPRQQPAQPPIRQLLGATDAQTAHHATFSTVPTHQPLGSANAEMTPAGAPAAAAVRTQRPDATCEGKKG